MKTLRQLIEELFDKYDAAVEIEENPDLMDAYLEIALDLAAVLSESED